VESEEMQRCGVGRAVHRFWRGAAAHSHPHSPAEIAGIILPPTVQRLQAVQPDAVCEVGGSTPDLSYGDLGISLGEAKH